LLIRHCVEESNVDEGQVLDPTKVRHVTMKGGKVGSLSGFVDPASHLNLDYPDHKVTVCVIAEKFSVGAAIRFSDQGLSFATVRRSSYTHYGFVDYTQRLSDMIASVKSRKKKSTKKPALRASANTNQRGKHK
jgi:hypothetical protein